MEDGTAGCESRSRCASAGSTPAVGNGTDGAMSPFGAVAPTDLDRSSSAKPPGLVAAVDSSFLDFFFALDLADAFFDEEGARDVGVVLGATLVAAGVPIFAARVAPALGFFGDDMAAHSAGTGGLRSSDAIWGEFRDLRAVG